MSSPSQVPVRYPSGMTTDYNFQPLGFYGFRNPFFYHEWEDDFDGLNAVYTQTKTSTGTIAPMAGDGGRLLFTTAATAADLCSIQLPAASFYFLAGKKQFFLTRVQISDTVNAAFSVGLMNVTATPFAPTDGLFFKKASGAATLVLASMVGGVETDLAIPAAAYSLQNATDIDLGWYVDRKQNVYAFVGAPLVGYAQQNVAPLGPVAGFQPALTGVGLTFTLAVGAGTASAKTMNVDFGMAAKER